MQLKEQAQKEYIDVNGWVDLNVKLPKPFQLVDVYLPATESRQAVINNAYVYQPAYPVSKHTKALLQDVSFYFNGLYEMSYYLEENLITHWRHILQPPASTGLYIIQYQEEEGQCIKCNKNIYLGSTVFYSKNGNRYCSEKCYKDLQ